jgi:hypothetical protein
MVENVLKKKERNRKMEEPEPPAAGEAPVLWPLRFGLALPYVTDTYHPEGELDLGLHAGFLPSNRIGERPPAGGEDEDDAEPDADAEDQTVQVRARAASTYARMIAQEEDDTVRDSQALGTNQISILIFFKPFILVFKIILK